MSVFRTGVAHCAIKVLLIIWGFFSPMRGSVVSDGVPPLRSKVGPWCQTFDRTWEEFVNTLRKVVSPFRVSPFPPGSPISSRFLRVPQFPSVSSGFPSFFRFPPTEKVDRDYNIIIIRIITCS